MKNAIKRALTEEHLSGAVRVFSNKRTGPDYDGQIRQGVLRSAIDNDTFVIAGIGRYDARRVIDTDESNRRSAHYVLIVGYNPEVAHQYFVFDPLYPGRLREVELMSVVNPDRQFDSIRWRFTDVLDQSPTILLEDLIVTKASQP